MRTLLAKKYNTVFAARPDLDDPRLTDLFGSARKGHVRAGRVLFSDMVLSNWEELRRQGVTGKTEVKFENTISRTTALSNPRQIERVVRGAEFPLSLIYETDPKAPEEKMIREMTLLADGLHMLEYDYLGGSGSRGYGRVAFRNLDLRVVIGTVGEETLLACRKLLRGETA